MLSLQEKVDLDHLVSQNEKEIQDNTLLIQQVKHSHQISEDINQFITLKQSFFTNNPENITKEQGKKHIELFKKTVELNCNFLFTHYPDIYKKMIAGELNLVTMNQLIHILQLIENKKINQHEGSALFGKILKEVYIDPVLQPEEKKEHLPLSWKEYKNDINYPFNG